MSSQIHAIQDLKLQKVTHSENAHASPLKTNYGKAKAVAEMSSHTAHETSSVSELISPPDLVVRAANELTTSEDIREPSNNDKNNQQHNNSAFIMLVNDKQRPDSSSLILSPTRDTSKTNNATNNSSNQQQQANKLMSSSAVDPMKQ